MHGHTTRDSPLVQLDQHDGIHTCIHTQAGTRVRLRNIDMDGTVEWVIDPSFSPSLS